MRRSELNTRRNQWLWSLIGNARLLFPRPNKSKVLLDLFGICVVLAIKMDKFELPLISCTLKVVIEAALTGGYLSITLLCKYRISMDPMDALELMYLHFPLETTSTALHMCATTHSYYNLWRPDCLSPIEGKGLLTRALQIIPHCM
jgi:hypothetical protein